MSSFDAKDLNIVKRLLQRCADDPAVLRVLDRGDAGRWLHVTSPCKARWGEMTKTGSRDQTWVGTIYRSLFEAAGYTAEGSPLIHPHQAEYRSRRSLRASPIQASSRVDLEFHGNWDGPTETQGRIAAKARELLSQETTLWGMVEKANEAVVDMPGKSRYTGR